MKLLEILLRKRWVLKSEDKELYYQIRDGLGEVRKFATDKMGCQIVENSLLVKLEKIPAKAESFMGIQEFGSREEYAYLCILLMFLEDKEPEEQFILSQLTEYIASNMPGETVDWTLYTCRRRLIKVLRYAVGQGLIQVTDGTDDVFMDGAGGEVLYENTGASRYFMKNFTKDIMDYQTLEDFSESEWFAMDEDRGVVRRHRVYKRLLFSVGMYKEQGQEEDFEYLKYYGRRLADDLEQVFDCRLHIHKASAFLMLGEDCHIGTSFPGNNVLSDILLLCCGEIRSRVQSGQLKPRSDESIVIDQLTFEGLLKQLKNQHGKGFTKAYREMTEGDFVRTISDEMERWSFLTYKPETREVLILPAAGKLQAHYPEDFDGSESENKEGNESDE